MLLCNKGDYLGDDKERQFNLAFINSLLQLLQIFTDILNDIIEWRSREDLVENIAFGKKVGTISGGTNLEIFLY